MKRVMVGFLLVWAWTALAEYQITVPEFVLTQEENMFDHPAAAQVRQTLKRGMQIVALKSESAKRSQMCQLVKSKMGTKMIGAAWLGEFRKLKREQAAINEFYQLVPSIVVTRMFDGLGSASGGSVEVDSGVKSKGKNVVEVSARVRTSGGSNYNVGVLVYTPTNRIIDATYMGFSAVGYMGREYQRILKKEYNKDKNRSKPVSVLNKQIRAEGGFINCG